jgi:hypothetical protein
MWKGGVYRIRRIVCALAILGTLLNAWVLVQHTRSIILASVFATSDNFVICHQGMGDRGTKPADHQRSSGKTCPICSGYASFDPGLITQLADLVDPDAQLPPAPNVNDALLVDLRLHRIFNRGPPRLS